MPKKKKNLTEQNKKWKPVLVNVHALQNFLSKGVHVSLIIVIFSKQQIIIMAIDVKSTLMLKLFILKYFTIVNAWLELNVAKKKNNRWTNLWYFILFNINGRMTQKNPFLLLDSLFNDLFNNTYSVFEKKKCILSNDLFNNTHSVWKKN